MMLPQLDALRAAGFTVEIACRITRHGDEMAAHADAVHPLPFQRSPVHPGNLQAIALLTRLIQTRRYAIVHAHTPVGGVAGRIAATLAKSPVRMYTAHGFHFHRNGGALGNTLYRTIETIAGRRFSDAVLVINGEDYDAALQHRIVTDPETLFLTGGVGISTDRFDPASVSPEERLAVRREIGAEDEAVPVLTFVGEMIPRKRHADLLTAYVRIRAARPEARLVLVGEGVLMAKVQRLARELKIEGGCRFLGFRRDIPALLAATDLFVFPSSQEGLPCAVQEALAMEVPTVATDVRGSRDLVRPDCGRLAPLGNPNALADACLALLDLPREARRAMGRAGRARMVADFERDACVAQWMEIYARLLMRRGIALPPGMRCLSGAVPSPPSLLPPPPLRPAAREQPEVAAP
ncbi:MAG: glycosyltransferase family 4 protein [Cytophagales bacterium]|nr:glycosyltransferase family 4 protein [Armatimonadota bacterium]